jgi:hypothetical protein
MRDILLCRQHLSAALGFAYIVRLAMLVLMTSRRSTRRSSSRLGRWFVDERRGIRNRFQPLGGDWLAGHLADSVSAVLYALEGSLDLLQGLAIELVLSQDGIQVSDHFGFVSLVADFLFGGQCRVDLPTASCYARLDLCPLTLQSFPEVFDFLCGEHIGRSYAEAPNRAGSRRPGLPGQQAHGRHQVHHVVEAPDVPAREAFQPAEPVVHGVGMQLQAACRRAHV